MALKQQTGASRASQIYENSEGRKENTQSDIFPLRLLLYYQVLLSSIFMSLLFLLLIKEYVAKKN